MFGGSASAVAILSAWSLLHLRLVAEGIEGEIVIQSNMMEYHRPICGAFTAASSLPEPSVWAPFLKTLVRRKRARIEVRSALAYDGMIAGSLSGRFVAFVRGAPGSITD